MSAMCGYLWRVNRERPQADGSTLVEVAHLVAPDRGTAEDLAYRVTVTGPEPVEAGSLVEVYFLGVLPPHGGAGVVSPDVREPL